MLQFHLFFLTAISDKAVNTKKVKKAIFVDFLSESGLPLSIVGSSYDGVGVNDAIISAKKFVEKVAAKNVQ